MPVYDPARHRQDWARALAPFCQHPEVPFPDVLTGADGEQAFAADGVRFGTSRTAVSTPPLPLGGWLSQGVHNEKACRAAARRVGVLVRVLGRSPGDRNSGTSCRARAPLPDALRRRRACQVGRRRERQVPDAWRWRGRHVHRVDGFVVSLPDTPENQRRYLQPPSQEPGWGYPWLRLVLVVSLLTAWARDLAYGPYAGKETGETALFRGLPAEMVAGDVGVLDRYDGSYFRVAQAQGRGLAMAVRLHQRRRCDFRRGRRLGRGGHRVVWRRPERPGWMSAEEYATIPRPLTVREVRVPVAEPGFRVESVVVVATWRDSVPDDKEAIGDLYRERWQVELDSRSLKVGLQMDHLRCRSPFRVDKEVWAKVLSYNLIRKVAAQAALMHNYHPRQISFTAPKQAVEGSWQALSVAGRGGGVGLGSLPAARGVEAAGRGPPQSL